MKLKIIILMVLLINIISPGCLEATSTNHTESSPNNSGVAPTERTSNPFIGKDPGWSILTESTPTNDTTQVVGPLKGTINPKINNTTKNIPEIKETTKESKFETKDIIVGEVGVLGNGRTNIKDYWKLGEYVNNKSAVDPTYKQALEFIKADKTDEIALDNSRLINDTIKMHNSAEQQGFRAGIIVTQSYYFPYGIAMGIVFNTTDKGQVCFTCVYEDQDFHPATHDVTMEAKIGSCTKFVDINEHKAIKTMLNKDGFETTGIDMFW